MWSLSLRSHIALSLFYALGVIEATAGARDASPGAIQISGKGTGLRHYNWNDSSSLSSSSSGTITSVEDFKDLIYEVDLVLGGQKFRVQMDTGSADLWVLPGATQDIQLVGTTGLTIDEIYGSGDASGNIEFAELQFGGFTVPFQAFLLATSAENFGFLDDNEGAVGILGLSFEDSDLSPINYAIKSALEDDDTTIGATPIFNIISQNQNMSNSFDILLGRTNDLNGTAIGSLVIGTHLPNFEDITSQPRLPRVYPGRWTIVTDGMTVNGAPFHFSPSSVEGVANGKIATVLDTGFTFPPLPPAAVDFIYGSIPGAEFVQSSFPQWIVPCMGTTNLTFTLGGVEFPVHPLDLTYVDVGTVTIGGQPTQVTYCYNAYQYLDLDPNSFSGFDAILGDSFLRNVYASFNYGDAISTGDQSFVQLLSTTNITSALPDFFASRAKTLASLPPELLAADFKKLVRGGKSVSNDDVASRAADTANATSLNTSGSRSSNSGDKLYPLVKE